MTVQRIKMALAPLAWRILTRSTRLEGDFPDPRWPNGPHIFACLHRDILPSIMHVQPAGPALLVSKSPDGDILIRVLKDQGYRFVRGATGEDGGQGFKGLVRMLKDGVSVGLAVDGPVGPFGTIHEGVFSLARLTGVPIIPLKARTRQAWMLGTWDRTLVPLPWSRVVMQAGPSVTLERQADTARVEEVRSELKSFLLGEEASRAHT